MCARVYNPRGLRTISSERTEDYRATILSGKHSTYPACECAPGAARLRTRLRLRVAVQLAANLLEPAHVVPVIVFEVTFVMEQLRFPIGAAPDLLMKDAIVE